MTEKKISIDNLEINYKTAGNGPAVLILHGWGGSSNSWVKVQKILAGQGFKVICPDLPGFGKSKTPLQAWDVGDYTKWVVDFADSLNLGNFFLIGHSFGGRVSVKFSINYPERLKGLILCDSAGIKQKWGSKERLIFFISNAGNAIFTPKFMARAKDVARNIFYIFIRHKDYVKANGTMKETIQKVLDEDLLQDLSSIKTKTLIVWGKSDKAVPVKDAFVFKEKINDSILEILPGIGHSPNLEVPEKLSGIILKFMNNPN